MEKFVFLTHPVNSQYLLHLIFSGCPFFFRSVYVELKRRIFKGGSLNSTMKNVNEVSLFLDGILFGNLIYIQNAFVLLVSDSQSKTSRLSF